MTDIQPLAPARLALRIDPAQFQFTTTAELDDLTDVLGQARATEAIRFGIGIRRAGYNLFVLGSPGTGRHTVVRRFLEQQAATEAVAPDWVYVHSFVQPHRPHILQLPAGWGRRLRDDMQQLIEDLLATIPAVFESEQYRARRHELEEELKARREHAFEELRAEAENHGITLLRTPSGMAFAPTRNGEVISPEEYEKLPEADKKRTEEVIAVLEEKLERIIQQIQPWRREGLQRIHALDREVMQSAVGQLLEELHKTYHELPAVLSYLETVQQAILDNADMFRNEEEGEGVNFLGMTLRKGKDGEALQQFSVNLLIDNGDTHGAPVIAEDNPTFPALIGRIEHLAQMGTLVTDFTLIKAGALHRANGGYLVLDAMKVLMQPFAWEGLKRALRAGALHIESLGQALSLVSTVSLEPEPMPLDLKVILVGEPLLYYLLSHYDPDFAELFKVAADFSEEMPCDANGLQLYARLLATMVKREQLLPLDRTAVARTLELSARLAEDAEKLSLHMRDITDLLREADYWAHDAKHTIITREDIQRAYDAKVYRADHLRERVYAEIERGTILIDTQNTKVGQVNGLSVIGLGQFAFGYPTRITASVQLGGGEVIDIQREVELGGPIHSKGVMILEGFVGGRYAAEQPLAMSARLTFEQTYGEVEGDSASSAELYALLSALATMPIKQSLAVTGSVNQHGEIQAIGGVNEKIEGFFDICRQRGLTGEQGVLIPAANVKHLLLREDVIQACAAKQFHVYAIETIDAGIALLTGVPAGERDASGEYPQGSINQLVAARLAAMAQTAREFAQVGKDKELI
jgi:lon-related putative ATP-dependent protease